MMKFCLFQYLCMQSCNAIYAESVMDIDVCHMNHIVTVNDSHTFIRIFSSYFII